MEGILIHKGKDALPLFQMLWESYPISEVRWETESHLRNAPWILGDYLSRVEAMTKRQRRQNGGSQRIN